MFRELVSVYMLAHARRQHEHEQGEHRQEDQASCGAMSGPAQTSQYSTTTCDSTQDGKLELPSHSIHGSNSDGCKAVSLYLPPDTMPVEDTATASEDDTLLADATQLKNEAPYMLALWLVLLIDVCVGKLAKLDRHVGTLALVAVLGYGSAALILHQTLRSAARSRATLTGLTALHRATLRTFIILEWAFTASVALFGLSLIFSRCWGLQESLTYIYALIALTTILAFCGLAREYLEDRAKYSRHLVRAGRGMDDEKASLLLSDDNEIEAEEDEDNDEKV